MTNVNIHGSGTLVSFRQTEPGQWYVIQRMGNAFEGQLVFCAFDSTKRTKILAVIGAGTDVITKDDFDSNRPYYHPVSDVTIDATM